MTAIRVVIVSAGLCGGLWPAASPSAAEPPPDIETVTRSVRPDRPRLFLTSERLAAIRQNGLSAEQQAWLEALKRKLAEYPDPPALDAGFLLSDAGGIRYGAGHAPRPLDGPWGHYAAHAALAWLLTGDLEYRDRVTAFLGHAVAEWELIRAHNRCTYSRGFVKMDALSAFDWLYNDLSPAERQALGAPLFQTVHAFYWDWSNREGRLRPFAYDFPMSYSDSIVGWYLGLAFLGAGIEGVRDDACLELLRDEYHNYLACFREDVPEPDGIRLCGAIGYFTQSAGFKINFLNSWRSATGGSFVRYMPQIANVAYYTLWATIEPRRAPPLDYGWADAYHTLNHMDTACYPVLNRVTDLFADLGDLLDVDALAAAAQVQAPIEFSRFLDFGLNYLTPASPLLMNPRRLSEEAVEAGLARLPRARYFPDPVGHLFMNSGWGSNDTYALFIAGRQRLARKHYDENHFTIYKQGFLAMDTGARAANIQPGDGDTATQHEVNYYYDTVAHNCVLIRMEGETLPLKYGGRNNFVNAGGMNRNFGAQVRAFETDALYTYIASDATSCYHSNKAAEVVRQFLFVYPDWFVVFDRVESKAPDQKKTWLFHTQLEPVETGDTFRAEHRDGAVCVRTLLPRDRSSEKIGGPGKEFWADGRNWPLGQYMQDLMVKDGQPTPDRHHFGQWRMEISSAAARPRELFLHLIEVGDKTALTSMTPSTLIEDEKTAGVEFQAGARRVRVAFNKAGEVGGQILIAEGGAVLTDRPLAVTVQPQEGLAREK